MPPSDANRLLGRLSGQRKRILATRGLLVLRLPAPPAVNDGYFQWDVEPQLADPAQSRWYFDGSLLNGTWKAYRSTGFGVVVTSIDGNLLGYGRGVPPHWCKTAASAEAWALCTILTITPFPPQMRTDCLALLTTAQAGHASATDPRRQLARIWCMISDALDGNLQCLGQDGMLVWMPAHQSIATVGEAKLSDGGRLTQLDWRANRLVDALAKAAAAGNQPPPAVAKILHSAKCAVKHSASLLGRVTHEANHHPTVVVGPDGQATTRICRDSVDRPRIVQDRAARKIPQPAKPPRPEPKAVKPWQPPLSRRRQPSRAAASRLADAAQVHRRVQEIGQTLHAPASGLSASERLLALRHRVLECPPLADT